MTNITIYPRGKMYAFYLAFKYFFLLGFGVLFTFSVYPFSWWSLFPLIGDIILLALLILQTYEIIRYKMIIDDNKVCLKANRDLFLTQHKDLKISYKGIRTIQFKFGVNLRVGVVSAIVLYYDEKYIKYLNTRRFNRKQINFIIDLIKTNAEIINGYSVEIKEPDIQK